MPKKGEIMSRKNNKREPPQKWECNSDHERFVRIFESMFESPAFIALTPVASRIYLVLKNEYRGNFTMNDYVLDTLGERELPKEFAVLKQGGSLVSLRWVTQKDKSISSFLSMQMEQDLIGSRRSSGIRTLRHPWMKCSAWMMSIWQ